MKNGFVYNGKEFIFDRISSFEDLERWWPFFLEGLPALNESAPDRRKLSAETLLQIALMCIELGTENALLGVITSKNDKPLLWVIVFNNTTRFRPKSCIVFAAYSNDKCPGLSRGVLSYVEKWAIANNFQELHAMSYNFNGSRFRLFEKTWKMRRTAVLFTKEL